MPLLALVAFLAPGGEEVTLATRLTGVAIGLGAIVALVAGRALPAQSAVPPARQRRGRAR